MRGVKIHWTEEQVQYMKDNIDKAKTLKDFADEFNRHFGTGYTFQGIKMKAYRDGLYSERDGRFNGATKKKGEPVGAERKWIRKTGSKDRHVFIKVSPSRWESKGRVVWESHHGKIPDGWVVKYIDGDISNCDISNLSLIKQAVNMHINRRYSDMPQELMPSVVALSTLEVEIFDKERNRK